MSRPSLKVLLPTFLGLAFATGLFAPSHAALAAIAYVQGNSASSTTGFSSINIPFGSAVNKGDLIVVGVFTGDPATTVTTTDSLGNSYAQDAMLDNQAYIFRASNSKAGANTVTVSGTGGDPFFMVTIQEYSGIDTSSPLDATSVQTGGSQSANLDSGSAVTHFADELIFGYGADALNAYTFTAGSSFTLRQTTPMLPVSGGSNSASEDRIVHAIGTYSATSTISSSDWWRMLMATYKAAAPSSSGIQVSSRSDTLSNSRPSATSNHSFAFTTNTQITGSSTITLTYPGAFTIPGALNCGDVDAATSSEFNFNYPGCAATATAWGFSVSGTTAVVLQAPTDTAVHVATGTPITIQIGSNATYQQTGTHWLTNPSSAGVYTISVGGTFGGSENIPVAINSGQAVQARVAENLSFTASSVNAVNCTANDGATVNAIATTATSIPFGSINSNTFYQGCQDLTVSTNALGGYSLTVQEKNAMQTANGLYTIPDTTCDASNCSSVSSGTWVTPTKYGLGHTCANVSGSDCNASFLNGTRFRPIANMAGGTTNSITYIQGANGNDGGNGNTQPTNVAFPNNTTGGNMIVVGITTGGVTSTIFDSQGNTFVHDVSLNAYGQVDIYHAANIKGGPDTVTVHIDNWDHYDVIIHEYSGVDRYSPLDVTSTNSGGSSTALDSGSKTTTFPNDLIFGLGFDVYNIDTVTAGANFALRRIEPGQGTAFTEDRVVNSTGSYNASATINHSTWWNMAMATFKASPQSGQVLMSNSGPAVSTGRAKYRLSASPNQAPGTYSTIITYTLTPTY